MVAATMIGTTAWVFDGGAESTVPGCIHSIWRIRLRTGRRITSIRACRPVMPRWWRRDALHIFDGRTGGVWSYSPNDGWRTRAERLMDIGVISTLVLHVGHDYLIPLARDGAMIRLDHAEAWHPITDRWSVAAGG